MIDLQQRYESAMMASKGSATKGQCAAGLMHQVYLRVHRGLSPELHQQQQPCNTSSKKMSSRLLFRHARETLAGPSGRRRQLLIQDMGSQPEEVATIKVHSGVECHTATQRAHISTLGQQLMHPLHLRSVAPPILL